MSTPRLTHARSGSLDILPDVVLVLRRSTSHGKTTGTLTIEYGISPDANALAANGVRKMVTGSKAKVTGHQDTTTIVDGILHINLKLGAGKTSSTGKSTVMASTGGFQPIPGTAYRYNLVVIKK